LPPASERPHAKLVVAAHVEGAVRR
jgi:hypothetical protein